MAHGLEKLERLFTGSRRKGRGRHKTAKPQRTSIINTRRPSSPVFPSPPYLRPTSTHMTPRDAQIDSPEWEKSRSQSVPTLQEALHKRSSTASSITVVNRSSRSDALPTPLRRRSRNSQITSRSFRFRFPEDSLFKSSRPLRTSEDSGKEGVSQELASQSYGAEPQGLLDWSPKHISLLFNPLEFKASSTDSLREPRGDNTESTLLPSPDFVPSAVSPASHQLVDEPDQPTLPHPSLSPYSSVQKLTLNPREQYLSSYGKPLLNSPSAANNNAGQRMSPIHRSMSLNTMAPSHLNTARMSSIAVSPMNTNCNIRARRNVRETWGNRLEDPQFFSSPPSGDSEGIPHPKLRKSASTSTLSVLTSQISQDRVLKEPTFDDFYALSDDDIAESRPATPGPLTPVKKIHNYHLNNLSSQLPTSQNITFKHKRHEITPPDTPIYCPLLTLSYSPTNPKDSLGALWAAVLAKKYDFAVLYVLSLWPVGGDHRLDVSTTALTGEPEPAKATVTKRLASSVKGPKISGRLLAAYGLSEVPSPFEIATDTHLAALDCDRWNEYRNVDARPNDISRGWIRPFYSDYAPVSVSSNTTGSSFHRHPKDRGIVFAAYSKQTSSPLIPMRVSPEQELLLQQLYTDAKDLVEALVKQPPQYMKATALY
ncbi:hypothetical protein F4859DRAFT_364678 [Xylaria cf. heliscus]|nr:hypothetical protein F4859DRAFT_364678 [Xylaria cf. heliscus]